MPRKFRIIKCKNGALLIPLLILLSLQTIWKFRREGYDSTHCRITNHSLNGEERGPSLPVVEATDNDHPHAGARDANGDWNYVPDVTTLRRNVLLLLLQQQQQQQQDHHSNHTHTNTTNADRYYFPIDDPVVLQQVCQVAPGLGEEGPEGYRILQRVQWNGPPPVPDVDAATTADVLATTATTTTNTNHNHNTTFAAQLPVLPPPRILCVIYTHDQQQDQLRAIVETWGWRCDGFLAASTKTIPDIGAVDLPHLGPEAYRNMWQKTRSILAYVSDHYIHDFDYVHVAGDDTHVIVENLRNYLQLLEESEGGRDVRPLYLGLQALFVGRKYGWEPVFNLGGPGYILNRLALQRFVTEALPTCHADEEFFGEDLNIARCLYEIGIFPIDTADAAHRQRFFNKNPSELARSYPVLEGPWRHVYKHWAKDHGWKVGLDLVSTQTVAFHHLKSPVAMRRHHAILYNACPVGTFLRDAANDNHGAVEFHLEIGY